MKILLFFLKNEIIIKDNFFFDFFLYNFRDIFINLISLYILLNFDGVVV